MQEVINKFKKGAVITFGENEAIITSELIKFNDYYYIVADITKNINFNMPCANKKIHDKVALIIRNMDLLLKMGLTSEERKAMYCHELGHSFSVNQQKCSRNEGRQIDEEVDSDTFAVEKCGIPPEIVESALKKTYEYEINHINEKKNLTQERLNTFIREMQLRKRNIERLIQDKDSER